MADELASESASESGPGSQPRQLSPQSQRVHECPEALRARKHPAPNSGLAALPQPAPADPPANSLWA